MMDETTFHYAAACSSPGCSEAPRYKIAAPWSHGPIRELKGYGLACERHLASLLARAEGHRKALTVRDDELVGPVEVFPLPSARPAQGT
jgi:hypothetical protein